MTIPADQSWEILDRLTAHLPDPDSPVEIPPIERPLVLLRQPDEPLTEFVTANKLGMDCLVAAEAHNTPEGALMHLLREGDHASAIALMAATLPPREGLWWGARFAWDIRLDIMRNWQQLKAEQPPAPPAQTQPRAEPPPEVPPKPKVDEAGAAEAAAAAMAPLHEALAAFTGDPTFMAHVQANPEIAQNAAAMTTKFRSALAAVDTTPPRQIIPRPSGQRKAAKPPEVSRDNKVKKLLLSEVGFKGHSAMRARRMYNQSLAIALQWITKPCQEHAALAGTFAKTVPTAGVAKALARATFWCGENVNLDNPTQVVPPSPALRINGLRALLAGCMAKKSGLLDRGQRTRWCITRGIGVATGESNWDDAMSDFNDYDAFVKAALDLEDTD
ncbi:MAG: hypothetical protein MK101_01635 [Phycisphaerales bacterium]|nr:hypothetical protein [Phycisphaerales bacterium]